MAPLLPRHAWGGFRSLAGSADSARISAPVDQTGLWCVMSDRTDPERNGGLC